MKKIMAGGMKTKIFQITIHLIAWGLLFGSPFIFAFGNNSTVTLAHYLNFCMGPVMFMVVFYANYFGLIDRLLFRKHLGRFVLYNLLLIVAANLVLHFWRELYRLYMDAETGRPRRHDPPPFYFFFLWNSMLMVLTAGLSVAIKMTGNWYRTEAEKQQIEKERTEAELKNLKSQLNPHFLFNTLNNIYALIQVNPVQAQYAVHNLGHLLRYVLYDNNQNFISLDKEFAFMKNYIDLMSLRLSDRVRTKVDIPDDGQGLLVAPLLFIVLVENAFKHGVDPSKESFVDVSLRIAANGTLTCTISNSCFPKKDDDRSGSGIGLENLRKRLNLIYPNRHILRTERLGDTFMSQLIIDL